MKGLMAMIKIQKAIHAQNPELLLTINAINMWKYLNRTTNGKLRNTSLKVKLNELIKESGSAGYLREYANNDTLFLSRQKNFYSYLLANDYEKLKMIIISEPNKLCRIEKEILNILSASDIYRVNGNKISQTPFGKILSGRLFKYSTYRTSQFCQDLYLDLNFGKTTCPYCNINEITIEKRNPQRSKKNTHIMYLELDHYFPKSLHPYFALSFYNLIPSCHTCNATIKGDIDFNVNTHIHPYINCFNELYKFDIPDKHIRSGITDELTIKKKIHHSLDRTILDLGLANRYTHRINEIHNLIATLNDNEHCLYSDEPSELADLQNYIFNMHGVKQAEKDISSKPYGKLFRDIVSLVDVHNKLELS